MQAATPNRTALFEQMVSDGGWRIDRLEWRVEDFFRHAEWRGKDVLEVGCGRGDLSIYMALNGARSVTALDPQHRGSREGHTSGIEERMEKLQLPNLTFHALPYQEFEAPDESFDLIFGVSVIEHIHETRADISTMPEVQAKYVALFKDFHRKLRPGGAILFTDVSRVSIWSLIRKFTGPRFKSPLARTVYWEIHQKHTLWKPLVEAGGFKRSRLSWRVPRPLRTVPWLANNRLFQYLTYSAFTFVAYKD